jgi:signal transduction protein with GAF and PtsI domain
MAGDPKGAMILAGLGVSELSMSIPSVAAIKARLRSPGNMQAWRNARWPERRRSARSPAGPPLKCALSRPAKGL